MACSSGCKTKDHTSYGECMRAKGALKSLIDVSAQKRADKNLDNYAQARKYGIQPKTTYKNDVDRAIAISEKTGSAFEA